MFKIGDVVRLNSIGRNCYPRFANERMTVLGMTFGSESDEVDVLVDCWMPSCLPLGLTSMVFRHDYLEPAWKSKVRYVVQARPLGMGVFEDASEHYFDLDDAKKQLDKRQNMSYWDGCEFRIVKREIFTADTSVE